MLCNNDNSTKQFTNILIIKETVSETETASSHEGEEMERDYFFENQCCEQPIYVNALISGTTFSWWKRWWIYA